MLRMYFSCKGRLSRRDYWSKCGLFLYPPMLVASILSYIANDEDDMTRVIIWSSVYLCLLVPLWATTTKRLHDKNNSAIYCLLLLIPYCWIVLLFFLASEGRDEANRYGPPPNRKKSLKMAHGS